MTARWHVAFGLISACFCTIAVQAGGQASPPPATRDTAIHKATPDTSQGAHPYFEFEVEKPAQLLSPSTTLHYPERLKGTTAGAGFVDALFVVDSMGVPEPGTLHIVRSTSNDFAQALRQQLPKLHFDPAKRHGNRVRQLVQMQFKFDPAIN